MNMQTVFEQLGATIQSRKTASLIARTSPKLFHKGADSILKKSVKATEVVICSQRRKSVSRSCMSQPSLLFHLMVMLARL